MKKTVSVICAALILVSSPVTQVSATNMNGTPTEKELNKYLEKSGYPAEAINLLEFDQKTQIFAEKGVFVSMKKGLGNLVENQNSEESTTLEPSDVHTESLSNFSHSLVMTRVTNHTPGKVEFLLDYNWDWNYDPSFTMDDRFGIAWTDDYDAYTDSRKYSYRAYGYLERPSMYLGCPYEYSSTTGLLSGSDKYEIGVGVGWKVNLISQFYTPNCGDYITNRHKGWGQVKIGKAHDYSGKIDSSSANAKYYHNEFSGSGELQFSAMGPAITLTGDSSYDVSPDAAAQWDWYHKD